GNLAGEVDPRRRAEPERARVAVEVGRLHLQRRPRHGDVGGDDYGVTEGEAAVGVAVAHGPPADDGPAGAGVHGVLRADRARLEGGDGGDELERRARLDAVGDVEVAAE